MTREEAEKVLRIMAEADGRCEVCARELFQNFAHVFPEYRDVGEKVFNEIFGSDLYLDGNYVHPGRLHAPATAVMYDFGDEVPFMR